MLFEKLSEQDVRLINSYIDEFGANPGSDVCGERASLKHLLRYWDAAKSEYLYQLFGNKFILEKHIKYEVPAAKVHDQIVKSLNTGIMRSFVRLYMERMNRIYPDYWSDGYSGYTALINANNLVNNTLENAFYHDHITLEFGDGQKIKLEPTTKPMRALGKIAKILDLEEAFEEFRLEHSRILNQKKLEGTLCLSIHPMDYMTMSDNASRWNSCMKWVDAGSYRMGTVEMMNSECVVVAYLKSDNSTWFDWNDKHWRTLIIAHKDIITSIKGYPYSCDEVTQMCIEWLKELAAENLSWSFGHVAKIIDQEIFQYGENNWYQLDFEACQMYNDFGCATHWGALPLHIGESSSQEDPYQSFVNYSGQTECMWCGGAINNSNLYNYDESYVFCSDCCSNAEDSETAECNECGEWWDYDDMYYVEGDYICPNCVDNVAAVAVNNGEYYYLDNLVQIYIASHTDNPAEGEDEYCYFPARDLYRFESSFYNIEDYCCIKAPRMTSTGVLYFNRDDMEEAGLRSWFHLYLWNSDSYFKDE